VVPRLAPSLPSPCAETCALPAPRSPLFVTLKAPPATKSGGGAGGGSGGEMVQRGCIGNLTPQPLCRGLWEYARSRCVRQAPTRLTQAGWLAGLLGGGNCRTDHLPSTVDTALGARHRLMVCGAWVATDVLPNLCLWGAVPSATGGTRR
jgi:hypothetical protein